MSPTSPRQPGGARQQAASVKVHRDSHLIHKAAGAGASSSSSTNSSVSSSPGATTVTDKNGSAGGQRPAPRQKAQQQQQQQQPVIIYTHSPKVIRTNPRDFMSIVQKLTGLESTAAAAASAAVIAAQDESSSSSNESCAQAHAHAHALPHYMDPHLQIMPRPTPLDAHFMPDIPLFAPGVSEQLLYGHQFPRPTVDAAVSSLGTTTVNIMHDGGAGGSVFSPSMLELEAMRTSTFPDYQLT